MSFRRTVRLALPTAACLLLLNTAAFATQTGYLELAINGSAVQGEATHAAHPDSIEVYSFSDGVTQPVEGASGRASGKRQHKPVTITKAIDRSTPILFQAMVAGDAIDGAVFHLYRPGPSGNELYMSVTLVGGTIAFIRRHSPDSTDPATAGRPPTETVGLTYDTITFDYINPPATGTGDWAGGN